MGNVYSITLCDRDLHHVPDDIYKHHKHVAKLLLRRNNIQEIPPEIKVLTSLVELSLRDNLLTTVPIEVGSFPSPHAERFEYAGKHHHQQTVSGGLCVARVCNVAAQKST
jgi:hypothetical protein